MDKSPTVGVPVVCRTCLEVVADSYMLIDRTDGQDMDMEKMSIRDKIQYCLPELDLYTDWEPLICLSCLVLIRRFYRFKSKTLEIEEKIQSYMAKNRIEDSKYVQLLKVKQFLNEENLMKIPNTDDKVQLVDSPFVALDNEQQQFETEERPRKIPKRRRPRQPAPPPVICLNADEPTENQTIILDSDSNSSSNRAIEATTNNHTIPEVPSDMYRCLTCTFQTDNQDAFQMHECTDQTTENCASQMNSNSATSSVNGNSANLKRPRGRTEVVMAIDGWYFCNQCTFRTIDLNILKCHVRANHNNRVNFNVYSSVKNMKCSVKSCLYRTNNKELFQKHMDRHYINKTRIKCHDCDYTTYERKEYMQHRDEAHTPVKCPICGYHCGSAYVYKFHMTTTHSTLTS